MRSFEIEFEKIKQICNHEEFVYEVEKAKELLFHRNLVLYGAGTMGVSTAKTLKHYGINVSCFCDKNRSGIQEDTGLPVKSPEVLNGEHEDANILICSVNFKDEIIHDLDILGINPERIFTRDRFKFHEMTYSDMKPHIAGYERAFDLLFDDKSKKVLLERLQCYLTSRPISSLPQEMQYFDPEIITLSGDECFVDGGMYTGDTAGCFFQVVNDNYKNYYGFEPDKKNFDVAEKNLSGKSNVTIVPKGLWSKETRLAFNENCSSSSQLSEKGGNSYVEVTALDTFFRDKTPPTFIKMDIEGAELEALKGAEHIIREHKPKLAICAYHKPEDPYTLLEQIKSFRDDYKFYLRHYTESIYETVLYAV